MAKRYHGDQFIVQYMAELFVCPDCGFRFDAIHEQDDEEGGYVCPACRELELEDALIEINELTDEFFNVEVIDGQPTFVLKEGLEAYSDIIHEIAIVSNEAVNEKEEDDQ